MAVIRIYLSTEARLKVDPTDYDTTFPNSIKEFSSICEKGTYEIPLGWSYGGTQKTNVFRVTISGDPYYTDIFQSYDSIKVTKDGNVVFLGTKPTYKKTVVRTDYYEVVVSYSDLSKGLDTILFDFGAGESWSITQTDEYKTCDPSDSNKSFLHWLFNQLNIDNKLTLYCTYTDTTLVPYASYATGDGVLSAWDKFLKQNGLSYYIDKTDLHIVDVLEQRTGTATTIHTVEEKVAIDEKPYIDRKVPAIRRPELIVLSDALVFDSDVIKVKALSSGGIYPETSESFLGQVAKGVCDYTGAGDNQEMVRIARPKVSLWIEGQTWPMLWVYEFSSRTAQDGTVHPAGVDLHDYDTPYPIKIDKDNAFYYQLSNENLFLSRSARVTVRANIEVLDYTHISTPPDNIHNGKEEKCEYVFSNDSAKRYINALLYAKDMERKKYSFYANEDIPLNSICVISNVTTEAEIQNHEYLRITDKVDFLDEFGGYTYTAVPYMSENIQPSLTFAPVNHSSEARSKDFEFFADRAYILVSSSGVPSLNQSIKFKVNLKEYYATPLLTINGDVVVMSRVVADTEDEQDIGYTTEWEATYTPLSAMTELVAIASLDGFEKRIQIPLIETSVTRSVSEFYISLSTDSLIPNYFKPTTDETPIAGKSYYVLLPSGSYEQYDDLEEFEDGFTYYEDAGWIEELPVSYSGHVWHRTKYEYSDGSVAYSTIAYYLQEEDVTNSFTMTAEYGISPSNTYVAETAQSPVANRSYYVREGETYRPVIPEEFETDVTYYYIPDIEGWLSMIPANWHAGLYVWQRDTIVYDVKPDYRFTQAPVVNNALTKELLASCKFSIIPQRLTYERDARALSTDRASIPLEISVVGYINPTPLYEIKTYNGQSLIPTDPRIEIQDNILYIPKDANISSVVINATIYYSDLGVNTPVQTSFSISSKNVTEESSYLGYINSLPDKIFLAGDHFVASESFGAFTALMPYVYNGSTWETPNNSNYGNYSQGQILYHAVKDIFNNQEYSYTQAIGTAQAGVQYYVLEDGVYSPITTAYGQSVSGLYTRSSNLPLDVLGYYNYYAKMLATYIGAHDIELLEENGEVGAIRSQGYGKHTVERIMKGELQTDRAGFYGDTTGWFEAFQAWLYEAHIYKAHVDGNLWSETLQTQETEEKGELYLNKPLAEGQAYWSGTEAVTAISSYLAENPSLTDSNGFSTLTSNYPSQSAENSRSKLIYIPNYATKYQKVGERTLAGGESYTTEFPTTVFVTEGEVTASGQLNKGVEVKNIKRWDSRSVYELFKNLTRNQRYSASGSYNGYSLKYMFYVNELSDAIFPAVKQNPSVGGYGSSYTYTYTVPDYVKGDVYINVSGYRKCCSSNVLIHSYKNRNYGSVSVSLDGVSKLSLGSGQDHPSNSDNNVYLGWSCDPFRARAGQTISVTLGSTYMNDSYDQNSTGGSISLTQASISAREYGVTATGISFESTSGNFYSVLANNIYQQSQLDLSVSANSLSFVSENSLLTATISWDYSQYEVGINLLNSDTLRVEALIQRGTAYELQRSLHVADNNVSVFSSSLASRYYNLLGFRQYVGYKAGEDFDTWDSSKTYYSKDSTVTPPIYTEVNQQTESPVEDNVYYILEDAPSFAVYDMDYTSISFKKFGETAVVITDLHSMLWASGTLTLKTLTGQLYTVLQEEFLESFSLVVYPIERPRGNYIESTFPVSYSNGRLRKIALGNQLRRLDEAYIDDVYVDNIFKIENNEAVPFISSIPDSVIDNIFI